MASLAAVPAAVPVWSLLSAALPGKMAGMGASGCALPTPAPTPLLLSPRELGEGGSACRGGGPHASVSLPAWSVLGMHQLFTLSLLCGFSHPNSAHFFGDTEGPQVYSLTCTFPQGWVLWEQRW